MSREKISIIIPAYNEEKSLAHLLRELLDQDFGSEIDKEIIVVDDCSTDSTSVIAENFVGSDVVLIRLKTNSGKGAAVRKGIENASGQYILIQDADLEYFPSDIINLLTLAQKNSGAVVYGSRVLGAKNLNGISGKLRLWPKQSKASWIFNFLLSCAFKAIYKTWISDTLTGYKLYPSTLFHDWKPISNGFEADHEITARIISKRLSILETAIHYEPRSKSEGKKIRAIDGIKAILTIWRYRR